MKKASVKSKAKKEFLAVLPLVLTLAQNRKLVKKLKKSGYEFDVPAIFDAIFESTGWKTKKPIIQKMAKKERKAFMKSQGVL